MRFSLLIVTFFLFRFHFLPQGRKFPPLSHYIVEKFFFLPRNCWVGGTNSHSPFRRCSEFFFEAPPPPPFVESSALLCKPTRLEVVPSCRESFFSPADGFRRPDVREPMPGRCRDYALLSFILPSSRCPFSPLPICSVSPVFSKPPPPLGFPPQVPPYEFPSIFEGKLWVPFLLYTSPLCSLYRLPLLLLGIIVHVSVIRLLFFLSFVLRKQNGSSLSFLFHLR